MFCVTERHHPALFYAAPLRPMTNYQHGPLRQQQQQPIGMTTTPMMMMASPHQQHQQPLATKIPVQYLPTFRPANPMLPVFVGPTVGGQQRPLFDPGFPPGHPRQPVARVDDRIPLLPPPPPHPAHLVQPVASSDATGNARTGGCAPVTSFSISDILEGRVGKRRLRTSTKRRSSGGVSPRSGSKERRQIVRPWDSASRGDDSCSRCSSGDENMEDESVDDSEDEDDGGVGESTEIDVEDPKSSTPMTSDKSVCPLGALLRMTSETNFDCAEGRLQDCLGDDSFCDAGSPTDDGRRSSRHHHHHHDLLPVGACAGAKCFRSCTKKRRKTRTAFTNQQIAELEQRFGRQKYLTPADRDEIAASLRLSSAQVITWFQNRRAKLKRDLEELKADVAAAKAAGGEPSTAVLDRLAELTRFSGLQQSPTAAVTTGSTPAPSSSSTPKKDGGKTAAAPASVAVDRSR